MFTRIWKGKRTMGGVKQYPIWQNSQRFGPRGRRRRPAPVATRWRRLVVKPLEDRTLLSGGPTPFPTPVLGAAPAGGLIYDTSAAGGIQTAGGQASFTLPVDAGQTLSVDAFPDPTLQAQIQLFDPNGTRIGNALAGSAGAEAVLQPVPASLAGTYTLEVTGAGGTTGNFTAEMVLNAALDTSAHGGASNSTQGTAESLNSSTVSLGGGADRLGVLGQFNNADEWYSFHLNAGQSATVGLAVNTPSGPVFPSGTDYAASGPRSVTYADLNGDGIPDMIYANVNSDSVGVRLGLGHGLFGPETDYATDGSPYSLAVGDFNGDGKLDVVTANYNSGDISVLFGNGDGTLQPSPSGAATNHPVSQPNWVTAGDLNHDGYDDIVVSCPNANAVAVFLNNGHGTFDRPVYYSGANGPNDVVIGDVNGDGVPDIVSADTGGNPGGGCITTWLGRGDGSFGQAIDSKVGNRSTGLVLGDFNGDGKLDVATADGFNSTVSIGLGNGDGTFTPDGTYSTGSGTFPWKIAAGDVTGSGLLDLAVVIPPYEGQSQAAIFLGNGDGTFHQAQFIATGLNTTGVALTDVTGDGLADLSVANQDSNAVTVYPSTAAFGHLALYDGHGNELALAHGASNLNQVVNDFVAPADGTYYARITDVGSATYGLVVTRVAAFATQPNGNLKGAQNLNGNTSVLGNLSTAASQAWYAVSVNAGDTLTVSTATPAGDPQQPYEPENKLDPAVQLYDPSGHLVASDDNSGSDGKNAYLTYTALATGEYRVGILAVNKTTGDYVLDVLGATGAPAKFKVTATNPANGALRASVPSVTVTFSAPVLLKSLAADDLTVDGNPATGFQVVNDHTVIWTLPALPPGENDVQHTFVVSHVKDLQGLNVTPYQGHFFVENAAPRVIGSSIQEGDVLPAGNLTYVVKFNQVMDASRLNAADFLLHGQYRNVDYAPASFAFDATDTVLTLTYAKLPDDAYTETLYSSGFADAVGLDLDGEPVAWPIPPNESGNGSPGGDFYVDFALDVDHSGPAPFPTPLQGAGPAGALIYSGSSSAALRAGDTDHYTVSIDPHQLITVDILPNATLEPTIDLYDPNGTLIGSASASAPGAEVVLQTVPTTDSAGSGTYTLVVGDTGGTAGFYTADLILNAALDTSSHGGPSNSTQATAQPLDGSSVPLSGGADRLGVVGQFNNADEWYSFQMNAGQSATLGMTVGQPTGPLFPSATTYAASGGPSCITYADLNGDGIPDMIFGNGNTDTVGVRLGLGGGLFGPEEDYATGGPPSAIAVADLAGDGKLDVVVADSNQEISVLYGNGDGTLQPSPVNAPGTTYYDNGATSVVLADLNHDGYPDMVTAEPRAQSIYVWMNRGNGTFSGPVGYHPGTNPSVPFNTPWQVAVADVNGDGIPDIVSANVSSVSWGGNITTLLGKGDGTFGPSIVSDVGIGSASLALADFNGDGKLDVVTANTNTGFFSVSIGYGNGDGSFSPGPTYSTGFGNTPYHVAAADLSGDGRPDFVVTCANYNNAPDTLLFVNHGDGTFAPSVAIPNATNVTNLALADVNGDGLPDLTLVNAAAQTISVYPSAGARGLLSLYDSAGDLLAHGYLSQNLNQVISDFVAPADGTYYARITDVGSTNFSLVITRGAAFDTEPHPDFAGAQDLHGNTAVLGNLSAATPGDWYSVSVNAGDQLTISTATPGGDPQEPGQPKNELVPAVELYDLSDNFVASDQGSAPDGKNDYLTYTALATGDYRVHIFPANGSAGDYVLSVQGATGAPTPFTVTATNPPKDALLRSLSSITVTFSARFLYTSLAPSDLTIDGVAATGFQVVDDFDVTWTFPTLPANPEDGVEHEVVISGVRNLQGLAVQTYQTDFFLDNVPPRIVQSSIQEGGVVQSGGLTYTATFSEPMDPTLLTLSDFQLYGQLMGTYYYPDYYTFDSTNTVLTVRYASLPEDAYTLTLFSSGFADRVGLHPVSDFNVDFTTDIDPNGPVAFPALQQDAPAGSLVYDGTVSGGIVPAGESDSYTLSLNPGQTVTLDVTSTGGLQPAVALYDPNGALIGSATAPAADAEAVLQTVPTTNSAGTGLYTIVVSGASGTVGYYTVHTILNAALQGATHGGPSDSTPATAQDIMGSSIPLGNGADRLAVQGTYPGYNDVYSFHLAAGQSVSVSAKYAPPADPVLGSYTEYDTSGNAVAFGDLTGNGRLDMVADDNTSPVGGALVSLNNGDGTFGTPTLYQIPGYYITDVKLADVNGDGRLDIVLGAFVYAGSPASVIVLLGNGDGTFGAPIYSMVAPYSQNIALADVNGDGKLDVVQTDEYDSTVNVAYGNGDGTFTYAASYPTLNGGNYGYPTVVALADMNGDGHPDIVVDNIYGYSNGSIAILMNNGDGTFANPVTYATNDYSPGMVVADLNGDGHPDVALTQYYNGQVAVFLNNGDGTLAAPTFYSSGTGTNPLSVAVGDVTGDGIPDLVVALVAYNFDGAVGPNVATLPGNGDGTFGPAQIFVGPEQSNSTVSVVVADLNGDGVADAAVANYYGTVDVFLSRANPLHVQLLDPSGNVVADGVAGAPNVDESISNFVAPADGTYYVRMAGEGSGRDYTVAVTRGATFDLENNDTAAQSQDITNSGGALGTLYQPPAVGLGVNVNGLSSDDNPSQVNSPDTQIAVGPSQVVEVTQTSVRVFDKAGNVQETEQLAQVFSGISPNLAYFQPQLVYDDTAQRWYIAADSNDPSGGIDINLAVSNDANPLDGFTEQHQLLLAGLARTLGNLGRLAHG
jgi:hypothetical protein